MLHINQEWYFSALKICVLLFIQVLKKIEINQLYMFLYLINFQHCSEWKRNGEVFFYGPYQCSGILRDVP